VSESDSTLLQWIQASIQGDQDAFAEIVYSYMDAVFNLCYRMLGERTEAEDATQEAFLRAYNNLSRYDMERSFKTWLLSIASNHCIDRIRKRKIHLMSLDEPLPSGLPLEISSDAPIPEDIVIRREQTKMIQGMLDELAPEYRAAVVLRYWYDYSYIEIAQALNTTESAIKSRLFRARQMLAEKYEDSRASQPERPINPRLIEG
jgi:RNA polymerase sigma-70 factor, ECF subfamily